MDFLWCRVCSDFGIVTLTLWEWMSVSVFMFAVDL